MPWINLVSIAQECIPLKPHVQAGALGTMKLFGKKGLRVIIGYIVEMAQLLAEHLEGHACMTVLNRDNFGPVTLFRVYPDGVDTFLI